jgi:hypothetical protein
MVIGYRLFGCDLASPAVPDSANLVDKYLYVLGHIPCERKPAYEYFRLLMRIGMAPVADVCQS